MSNTSRPSGGNSLDAWKQDRQKAKDEAKARRRREAEEAARNHRVQSLFAPALDHANAIDAGRSPPSADDAADFLIRLRAGLVEYRLLRWLDAMEKLDPTPLHCFVLSMIREAMTTARKAVAQRLKTELTGPELCGEFWSKIADVGGVFWDWLQMNIPEAGYFPPPAPSTPRSEEATAPSTRDPLPAATAQEEEARAAARAAFSNGPQVRRNKARRRNELLELHWRAGTTDPNELRRIGMAEDASLFLVKRKGEAKPARKKNGEERHRKYITVKTMMESLRIYLAGKTDKPET